MILLSQNEDPLTHEKIAYDAYEGVGQFFKMSFFGILIGFAFGWIAINFIHVILNDALSEVAITLVVAYGSFVIAESAFHVSGVLAVVAAGMYMALYRSEVSASVADFMHETWELLSYLLNTTLLLLLVYSLQRLQTLMDLTLLRKLDYAYYYGFI